MNHKLHSSAADRLFDAILTLQNREECYQFFECRNRFLRFESAAPGTHARKGEV